MSDWRSLEQQKLDEAAEHEHKHKMLYLTSGGFYCAYVDCDLELRESKDFMALLNRIKALEGVVEAADRWSEAEARWQAHLTQCDKCESHEMCSEEWIDNSFAVIQAWKDTWEALTNLKKLEEV